MSRVVTIIVAEHVITVLSVPKLMKSNQSGYSLIELIVVMFVVVTLLGAGVLSYRDFSRRQQVIGAARQVKADLRLAQTEALAGKKPVSGALSCDTPTSVLSRYNFRRTSAITYVIEAVCVSPNVTVPVRNVTLPVNTTIDNFTTISFKPIGDGTFMAAGDSITIIVRAAGTTFTQSITVNSSGDIL